METNTIKRTGLRIYFLLEPSLLIGWSVITATIRPVLIPCIYSLEPILKIGWIQRKRDALDSRVKPFFVEGGMKGLVKILG